jgi:hypothetical protein
MFSIQNLRKSNQKDHYNQNRNNLILTKRKIKSS